MEADEKLQNFVVGPVPTLMYVPDFITDAEQTQLLNHIYQAPISKWKTLKNRRLQNWGGVVHEKGLLSQDLPPWLTKITERICEESGLFPAAPNHVLINEYLPHQGIMPHQDGPAYFPTAAILSLESPVVMDFTTHSRLFHHNNTVEGDVELERSDGKSAESADNPQSFSVLLMPRSLLIFKDMAYSGYLHGIEDSVTQRYDTAVNRTELEQLLQWFKMAPDQTTSIDPKVFQRTNKRVSLTCRLVPKVHKNLIKV